MTQTDGGKRQIRLLIVDDSNIMRRRIERSQQFEELEVVGSAANGFLNKPFTDRQLNEAIADLMT